MNITLWILTGLLAAAFLGAGLMKLTSPREKVTESMPTLADFSGTQIRLIGLVELLGALGLVLPAVTGIATVLVPVAALGLLLTMVGAGIAHLRRGDPRAAVVAPSVLAVLALVVAVGRFGPASF
ncbi:DoxX family protein [Actinotalea sp.]|uniref:DoxX family protein n=1 Tax=Actinotalea sp. TaxID=1872145 RepID=UPI003561C3D2